MKPLRSWLARLAFVGAWAVVSGCGSGDVPDPSNDASGQLPGASGPPPVNAPPAAESPQVASAETKTEDAKPEEAAAAPEPAAAAEPAAAPEPAAASAASSSATTPDKNSATADLLAMSTKEPQAAPAAGSGDGANPQAAGPGAAAAPGPGGPGPGGPGPGGPGPGGGPPNMGPGMGRPGGGMGPMNMGPNAPGAGAGMNPQAMMGGGMQAQMQSQQQGQMQQMQAMQAQMQTQMQRGMGGPGGAGAPGGPGGMMGPGGPGGPGGSSKAPDFRSPQGAVQAFLDAVKEKDLGKLTDATALRAPAEATKRNQDMFTRILDGTYSKEELDKLASFLDGYQLTALNQAKSTGRQSVMLSKRGDNNSIQRVTITARREKKGWGVCDISGVQTLKSPRFGPVRSNSSKR